MKRSGFPGLANTLHRQRTSGWTLDRVHSAMRAIARVVADEHTLALRAASKAASPRKTQAELRVMYVPAVDTHGQNDEGGLPQDGAQRAPSVWKARADLPSWSAPFPKPVK